MPRSTCSVRKNQDVLVSDYMGLGLKKTRRQSICRLTGSQPWKGSRGDGLALKGAPRSSEEVRANEVDSAEGRAACGESPERGWEEIGWVESQWHLGGGELGLQGKGKVLHGQLWWSLGVTIQMHLRPHCSICPLGAHTSLEGILDKEIVGFFLWVSSVNRTHLQTFVTSCCLHWP